MINEIVNLDREISLEDLKALTRGQKVEIHVTKRIVMKVKVSRGD